LTSVSPYLFSLSTCTFVVEKMFIIDCVISFSRGGVVQGGFRSSSGGISGNDSFLDLFACLGKYTTLKFNFSGSNGCEKGQSEETLFFL